MAKRQLGGAGGSKLGQLHRDDALDVGGRDYYGRLR